MRPRRCGKDLNKNETYSFQPRRPETSRCAGRTAPSSPAAARGLGRGEAARSASTASARTGAICGRGTSAGRSTRSTRSGWTATSRASSRTSLRRAGRRTRFARRPSQLAHTRLATRVGGDGYDLYDDTRSQVYGGKGSETSATNKADSGDRSQRSSRATVTWRPPTSSRPQAVRPRTASSASRAAARGPYLKAVNDPHDDTSPYHRWTVRYSQGEMESKLSGLFGGNLKKIEILEARPLAADRRGASGRLRRLLDGVGATRFDSASACARPGRNSGRTSRQRTAGAARRGPCRGCPARRPRRLQPRRARAFGPAARPSARCLRSSS